MSGTSKGIAAAIAGVGIFAAAAGWLYYDYMRIPPDVVAAYRTFFVAGDPVPLAALGDRARPVVPQLAEILETTGDRQRRDDTALLLGIIGGQEAIDALIKRLDEVEANRPRHRFRYYSSYTAIFALAMLDSPRGAERLLTYHFESEIETTALMAGCLAFESIPDDPEVMLRALRSPKADADRIAVLNLSYASYHSPARRRILASDDVALYLTERYRRFMTKEAPWYELEDKYLRLLDTMTAPRAQAFIDAPPEERRPKRSARPASKTFASAGEIADGYEAAGGTWRIKPIRRISYSTDFSDSARLAAILNADPSRDAWRFMCNDSTYALRAMGASITPFLVSCMEQNYSSTVGRPHPSVLEPGQLERLYLLRRATGRNFGLNPEAWRRWWEEEGREEEGREEFAIGR